MRDDKVLGEEVPRSSFLCRGGKLRTLYQDSDQMQLTLTMLPRLAFSSVTPFYVCLFLLKIDFYEKQTVTDPYFVIKPTTTTT